MKYCGIAIHYIQVWLASLSMLVIDLIENIFQAYKEAMTKGAELKRLQMIEEESWNKREHKLTNHLSTKTCIYFQLEFEGAM